MPSGKTHDRITFWTLPWIVVISFLLTRKVELILIVAGSFLFSGLMFGPDLDLYSIQFKRWGKLSWLWIPYQKMLSHRSQLSHGLLIGTIFRLLYLGLIINLMTILIITITQIIWRFDWHWQEFYIKIWTLITQEYAQESLALFCGLELGSISHSLSDIIVSYYKKNHKIKSSKSKNKK